MAELFDKYGWFVGSDLPAQCVADCSASGDVSCWDTLDTDTDQQLAERVLWLACCDIAEHGEWLGLTH